ncbi:MAG: hypothetical protein ACPMAQ_05315, partial [Phycisphaerae bacterium]
VPPGLDVYPLFMVRDYAERVPPSWRDRGGAFIPIFAREALWISFSGRWWKPNAVRVGVDGVNAVTGRPLADELARDPQDYIVVPDQPWLEAYRASDGSVRQFATELPSDAPAASPSAGGDHSILIELAVFEPAPGRFADTPPKQRFYPEDASCAPVQAGNPCEIAVGPNGKMAQRLCPDTYGVDAWDPATTAKFCVRLVSPRAFREITGAEPPPSPISADDYTAFGLPWLKAYADGMPKSAKSPLR